jgi:hypothetical protein
MRKIDDAGEVDDEGQAQRHQCVESADNQPIEYIEKY